MTALRLDGVRKTYGSHEVISGVDLDVASGEFIVFVGPSGCGKSTLLRLISGLETITAGTLSFGGKVVNALTPSQRGIAMVFQSYALYPHMTVYDNMAFGLKLAKAGKGELDRRVRRAAEMLRITPSLDRLPKQLSGGQRQRVAIGRAIVRDPQVFLFDEPLSNLDAGLRSATRIEIAGLHQRMPGTTMIYVTHDQVEAMTLADRIVVLNGGRIEQVGTPLELYAAPDNLFVARFIGSPAMNVVPCDFLPDGHVRLHDGRIVRALPATAPELVGTGGSLGVRPESLVVADAPSALFEGAIVTVEQLGEVQLLYVDVAGGEPVIAKVEPMASFAKGSRVALAASYDTLHVFDSAGRAVRRGVAAPIGTG
ncbi:MAG TPA: sn-glycerol-3-phosphate ABC transporter ATP-binding protein UgpC [Arenibaculum sp.]|nr:sn-glycerol-3-phosphate ABC transporter ATP-binding protein UgpC [Arenibaculum sp.]